MKLRVGVTGQAGFVGYHLYQTLALREDITLVPFERSYFEDTATMADYVKKCDVIVHLAAMNRHDDQQVIYDTNINLVSTLIAACENENASPHILFSSSSQESKDNLYGKSKKMGKQLFIDW